MGTSPRRGSRDLSKPWTRAHRSRVRGVGPGAALVGPDFEIATVYREPSTNDTNLKIFRAGDINVSTASMRGT